MHIFVCLAVRPVQRTLPRRCSLPVPVKVPVKVQCSANTVRFSCTDVLGVWFVRTGNFQPHQRPQPPRRSSCCSPGHPNRFIQSGTGKGHGWKGHPSLRKHVLCAPILATYLACFVEGLPGAASEPNSLFSEQAAVDNKYCVPRHVGSSMYLLVLYMGDVVPQSGHLSLHITSLITQAPGAGN